MDKVRTVLITGSAGFIGSELTSKLLKQNYTVIGIDNFQSGTKSNIEPFLHNPNFHFIQQDVSEANFNKIFNITLKIDQIYYLASMASPKFYQADPLKTIECNTVGLKNYLELAKENNSKILYSSTSEVYGDPEIDQLDENYNGNVRIWGPRACYDESKRLGEVYCYEYFKKFNTNVTVARIFNTYSGSLRKDDGRVISNFVTQALSNQDITVYGDGNQTRTFCYIDDTLDGLKKMMENNESKGQVFNIGHPKEYKIIEVAALIKEMTKSLSNIVFKSLPEDDPKKRRPSILKANQLLKWYPKISISEGIEKTIKNYKHQYQVK